MNTAVLTGILLASGATLLFASPIIAHAIKDQKNAVRVVRPLVVMAVLLLFLATVLGLSNPGQSSSFSGGHLTMPISSQLCTPIDLYHSWLVFAVFFIGAGIALTGLILMYGTSEQVLGGRLAITGTVADGVVVLLMLYDFICSHWS